MTSGKGLISAALLVWIILVFQTNNLHSQDYKSEKQLIKGANTAFDKGSYKEAVPLYSTLVSNYPKDPEYNFKYGASLLYGGADKEKPIRYLQYAVSKPSVDPLAYYFFGQALHMNYEFEKAIKYYQKFKNQGKPADVKKYEVANLIQQCENGLQLLKTITDLIVLDKKELRDQDFYKVYDLSDFGGQILTKTDDFKSDYDKKNGKEGIFYFPKNAEKIFFSSHTMDNNRGKDIYYALRNPDGSWSKPINMGKPINTDFDDDYPFMHPDGKTLYFASKGHNSLGGYDIFVTTINPETGDWTTPRNLDFAINTPADDYLFITDESGNSAYFSSNRESPLGEVNVYRINMDRVPLDFAFIYGTFTSESTKSAKIKVKDVAKEVYIGEYETDENGKYRIKLPNEGKFEFEVNYENSEVIHSGTVEMNNQDAFKPLKQEMQVVDQGTESEKLIIRNLLDEDVDEDVKLTPDFLKERAKLEVNKDQYADRVKPELVVEEGAASSENAGVDAGEKSPQDTTGRAGSSIAAEKVVSEIEETGGPDLVMADTHTDEGGSDAGETGGTEEGGNSSDGSTNENASSTGGSSGGGGSGGTAGGSVAGGAAGAAVAGTAAAVGSDGGGNESSSSGTSSGGEEMTSGSSGAQNSSESVDGNPTVSYEIDSESPQKSDYLESANANSQALKSDADILQLESNIAGDYASQKNAEAEEYKLKAEALLANVDVTTEEGKQSAEYQEAQQLLLQADQATAQYEKANSLQAKLEQSSQQSQAAALKGVEYAASIQSASEEGDDAKNSYDEFTSFTQEQTGEQDILEEEFNQTNTAYQAKLTEYAQANSRTIAMEEEISEMETDLELKKAGAEEASGKTKKTLLEEIEQEEQDLSTEKVNLKNAQRESEDLYVEAAKIESELQAIREVMDRSSLNTEIASLTEQGTHLNVLAAAPAITPLPAGGAAGTMAAGSITAADGEANSGSSNENEMETVTTTTVHEEAKEGSSEGGTDGASTTGTASGSTGTTSPTGAAAGTAAFASVPKETGAVNNKEALGFYEDDSLSPMEQALLPEEGSEVVLFTPESSLEALAQDDQSIRALNQTGYSREYMKEFMEVVEVEDDYERAVKSYVINESWLLDLNREQQYLESIEDDVPDEYAGNYQERLTSVKNLKSMKERDLDRTRSQVLTLSESSGQDPGPIAAEYRQNFGESGEEESEASVAGSAEPGATESTESTTAGEGVAEEGGTETGTALAAAGEGSDSDTGESSEEAGGDATAGTSEGGSDQNESGSTDESEGLAGGEQEATGGVDGSETAEETPNSGDGSSSETGGSIAEAGGETGAENTGGEGASDNEGGSSTSGAGDSNSSAGESSGESGSSAGAAPLVTAAAAGSTAAGTATAVKGPQGYTIAPIPGVSLPEVTSDEVMNEPTEKAQKKADVQNQALTEIEETYDQKQNELAKAKGKKKKALTAEVENLSADVSTQRTEAVIAEHRIEAMSRAADVIMVSGPEAERESEKEAALATEYQAAATEKYEEAEAKEKEKVKGGKKKKRRHAAEVKQIRTEADSLQRLSTASTKLAKDLEELEDELLEVYLSTPEDLPPSEKRLSSAEVQNVQSTPAFTTYDQKRKEAAVSYARAREYNKKADEGRQQVEQAEEVLKAKKEKAENETDTEKRQAMMDEIVQLEQKIKGQKSVNASYEAKAQENYVAYNQQRNEAIRSIQEEDDELSGDLIALANQLDDNGYYQAPQGNDFMADEATPSGGFTPEEFSRVVTGLDAYPEELEDAIFEMIEFNESLYNEDNPIPMDSKIPSGVVYKVQIGAFRTPPPQDVFKGFAPVRGENTRPGWIRYTAGLFKGIGQARLKRNEIRALGYEDAFVVAYLNGERISLDEAQTYEAGAPVPQAPIAQAGPGPGGAQTTQGEQLVLLEEPTGTSAAEAFNQGVNQPSTGGSSAPGEVKQLDEIQGLMYTVQVGAFSNPITTADLYNISPLVEYEQSGLYKYGSGVYNDRNQAEADKNRIVGLGVSDAFVTAFYNGRRVSMAEAAQIAQQGDQVFAQSAPISVGTAPATSSGGSNASNVEFRVQIGAYQEEVPVEDARVILSLSNLGIEVKQDGEVTTYTVGSYSSYSVAQEFKDRVVGQGLQGAFVVAFQNGQKIDVQQAIQLTGNQ